MEASKKIEMEKVKLKNETRVNVLVGMFRDVSKCL
jgi:hypothetical protein